MGNLPRLECPECGSWRVGAAVNSPCLICLGERAPATERLEPGAGDLIDFPVSWDWYRYYCQQAGRPDPGHNRRSPLDILEDIRQSQLAPKRKLQAGQWSQPKVQTRTAPFPVKSSPPTGGKRKTMGVRID